MFGTYGSATLDANMGTQFRPFRGDEFSLPVVFGIVFPSCTGVMSGVNMSGDLANAQHSIPRGTAAGYAFAIAHIFVLIFLLAGSVQRDALVTRTDTIMSESCYSSLLVLLGLLAAVVSSAISSLAAAPRLLQAMAVDRLIPALEPFARLSGPNREVEFAILAAFRVILSHVVVVISKGF